MGRKHDITDIYGVRRKKKFNFASDAPETGFRHSGYYHRYFRGYTEIRKKNAKGRVVVERYYTRPWIVSGLSNRDYWLVRLLFGLLTGACAVLFVCAMCRNIPGNSSWVVVLPGFPSAVALFLLVIVTFLYITVPRKMTLWDYDSSTKRLRVFSVITAIGQILTALSHTGYIIYSRVQVGESLLSVGQILVAAALAFCLFLLERKMPYTEEPNPVKLPEGEAHEIW